MGDDLDGQTAVPGALDASRAGFVGQGDGDLCVEGSFLDPIGQVGKRPATSGEEDAEPPARALFYLLQL